jgi:uncharacterized repeat protein (TIGR01451 family)
MLPHKRVFGRPCAAVSPITSFAYAVNRAGQRTQVVETFGSAARTIAYVYDGGRLTSAALISDTLPSGLTFVGGSLEINGTPANDPTLPTLADGVSVLTTTDTVITFAATVGAALAGGTVITNTASAQTDEDATLISSSVAITVASLPSLEVSITPDVTNAEVGDTITYSYQVRNAGNVTLDPVVVADAFGSVTLSTSSLAPGAEATGSTSYTVQESDLPGPLTNSVTATGTPPVGDDVSASASAAVALSSTPAIAVSVTPSTSSAAVGDEITYSYQVVNTGDVTLSGVSASDDNLGAVTLTSTSLAPGASTSGELSYTVQESDLPGPLANSVTATGTPPAGDDVSATASASVEVTDTSSGGGNVPTITSVFTSEVQARGVMLHATVNPNGLATTVSFAWGTTSGGPYPNEQDVTDVLSGTQVQTASLRLISLTPDTIYYYIATATNADGSATSSEQSFTTPAVTGGPAYGSIPEAGSTLDVGTVNVGESGTVSLEMREVGSAALEVSDPNISGADAGSFRIEAPANFPITIADGADAVSLSIVCTPQRDGAHSATLTLTTNDDDLPTVSYPLACTGEASQPVDTGTTLYLPLIAR